MVYNFAMNVVHYSVQLYHYQVATDIAELCKGWKLVLNPNDKKLECIIIFLFIVMVVHWDVMLLSS